MDSHPDVCNPAKDLLRNTRLQMEYISVPQTFPPLPSQPPSSSDFINGSSYQRLDRWQAKHWYTPCKDHHSIVHRKAAIFMPSLSKYGVKKFCTAPHSSFLSRPYDPYRPATPVSERLRSGGVPSLRVPSGRSETSWTVDLVLEDAVANAELDTPTYSQAMQHSPYRMSSAGGRGGSSRTPLSGSARVRKEVTLAPLPPRSRPTSGPRPPATLPTPGPNTIPPMEGHLEVQLAAADVPAAHLPPEDALLMQESATGQAAGGEPEKGVPSTAHLAANQTFVQQSSADQSAANQQPEDQSAVDKLVTNQPPEDQSAADRLEANEQLKDQPAADPSSANQPTENQPAADQSAANQLLEHQQATEQADVRSSDGVGVHDFPSPPAGEAEAEEELGIIDVPESPMPKGKKKEASTAEEEGSEEKTAEDDGGGTPASDEGSEGKKKKKKSKDKKIKGGNGEPEDVEDKKKKKKKEKPADVSLPPI